MDFQVTGLEGNQGTAAQAGPSLASNLPRGSVPVQFNSSEVGIGPSVGEPVDQVHISRQGRELSQAAASVVRANGTENEATDPPSDNAKPPKMETQGSLVDVNSKFLDYFINDTSDLAIKVIDRQTNRELRQIPPVEQQVYKANYIKLVTLMYGTPHPPNLTQEE